MYWIGAGVLIALPVIGLVVLSLTAERPHYVGSEQSRLRDCPKSPNCVCSQAIDERHAICPIQFEGSAEEAMDRLVEIVASLPRTNIVTTTDSYLHAEIKSRLFQFIDDLEFLCDEKKHQIHVRSASRVGHTDFGVNRNRVEVIRKRFATH